MSERLQPTANTTVRRLPERGRYDIETIHAILDEAFVCHIGFVVDVKPFVIPTTYARIDDRIVIHGSPASRMLRSLESGVAMCVTVTLIDGLVLARSAFHHSINYRSVVILGTATVVKEEAEKAEALRALVEHIVPGRTAEAREPNTSELKQTLVLTLTLSEASAKVRSGPPLDDEEDMDLPVWAGELPLRIVPGPAIADPALSGSVTVPGYVTRYRRLATHKENSR
jgi:nitroimidazol reductase NimA-like FMN-containing flavoprotein (pyridoxamine 5'-phosphate oxidase superfamily)